jgi:hypothetical protein
MTRSASGPAIFLALIICLQVMFRALWATHDVRAAMKPIFSKVGWFHEDAAIPAAMGIRVDKTCGLGKEPIPSSIMAKTSVNNGIEHFEVYVSEIPILFRLIEFV